MKISNELYGENNARAIETLMDDKVSQGVLLQRMGMDLLHNDSVLISPSLEQMMLIFSVPSFNKTDEEVVFVAQTATKYLKVRNILPLASEQSGYDFAARTLISCGFFLKALERRYERHAAPSPDFYRERAKKEFERIDREDVAENFDKWTAYMNEFC